jgi:hypothetical protein
MNSVPACGRISRRRLCGALAVLSAGGLLLSACTASHLGHNAAHAPAGAVPSAAAAGVPTALLRYYRQRPDWQPCADQPSFQCTTLKAPLDYAHPEAGDISLTATRLKATGNGSERIEVSRGDDLGGGRGRSEQGEPQNGGKQRHRGAEYPSVHMASRCGRSKGTANSDARTTVQERLLGA